MYHANFHTKMIIVNIFNQLKHIPSKALVAQWVHPFTQSKTELSMHLSPISTSFLFLLHNMTYMYLHYFYQHVVV